MRRHRCPAPAQLTLQASLTTPLLPTTPPACQLPCSRLNTPSLFSPQDLCTCCSRCPIHPLPGQPMSCHHRSQLQNYLPGITCPTLLVIYTGLVFLHLKAVSPALGSFAECEDLQAWTSLCQQAPPFQELFPQPWATPAPPDPEACSRQSS